MSEREDGGSVQGQRRVTVALTNLRPSPQWSPDQRYEKIGNQAGPKLRKSGEGHGDAGTGVDGAGAQGEAADRADASRTRSRCSASSRAARSSSTVHTAPMGPANARTTRTQYHRDLYMDAYTLKPTMTTAPVLALSPGRTSPLPPSPLRFLHPTSRFKFALVKHGARRYQRPIGSQRNVPVDARRNIQHVRRLQGGHSERDPNCVAAGTRLKAVAL